MNKAEVRASMKALNETMARVDHSFEDTATVTTLLGSSLFEESEWIFGFMPLLSEVHITPILEKTLQTKRLALPVSNGDDTLSFVEVQSLNEVVKGRFGIYQPAPRVEVLPSTSTLILVPALAYTPKKVRLGRGRGYYDRYLALHQNLVSVGVCRTYQLVEELPVDLYDRQVDSLICNGVWY